MTTKNNRVVSTQRGFSAFLHMKSLEIESASKESLVFISIDKTQQELELEYSNSVHSRYNASFIQISQIQRNAKR